MSSDRSNDDIQSELVEILGFEGDGLALVEELLRPGVREALMSDMRGSGPRVRHSARLLDLQLTIAVKCSGTIPQYLRQTRRRKAEKEG